MKNSIRTVDWFKYTAWNPLTTNFQKSFVMLENRIPTRISIRKDRNGRKSYVLKFINTRAKANIAALTTEDNLEKWKKNEQDNGCDPGRDYAKSKSLTLHCFEMNRTVFQTGVYYFCERWSTSFNSNLFERCSIPEKAMLKVFRMIKWSRNQSGELDLVYRMLEPFLSACWLEPRQYKISEPTLKCTFKH